MGMKLTTLSLALALSAQALQAANPAFTDFNTNQFTTTGNKVAINPAAIVTNTTINATTVNVTTVNVTTNNVVVHKGGSAVFTNDVTLLSVKTNILATDATGLITNVIVGTGLAYNSSTRTLTATASGGGGISTYVHTLAWSGTNLTGFNCATNGDSFYVLATNNAHFGSSTFSNLPLKSEYKTFTLCVQQDSTGGRIVTFTNSVVGWALAVPALPETNASAVSYMYFHTDLTTNSTLVATPNNDVRR